MNMEEAIKEMIKVGQSKCTLKEFPQDDMYYIIKKRVDLGPSKGFETNLKLYFESETQKDTVAEIQHGELIIHDLNWLLLRW